VEISQPHRVTRSYVQRLAAAPDRVFPLLCPVREADWIEGWDPIAVWSESGVAEPDSVFVTPADDGDAVWFITRHLPDLGRVEMLKITPGVTACKLVIQLTASDEGTDAEVTYSHTSLGPAGDSFVDDFTEEYYRRFMQDWESRLNHYLCTGEMLRSAHPA
jgi:hypothetical protein